jgi:hypothetical protein
MMRPWWIMACRGDDTAPQEDVDVPLDPSTLVGQFVVEAGIRQAWPFVTLCDNRPATSVETRIYIDAPIEVTPNRPGHTIGDEDAQVVALLQLVGLTVTTAEITNSGDLVVTFEHGTAALRISGEGTAATVAEPWWVGRA